MITFFQNIHTVSKYESKLLYRSWFFRIFSLLTILFLITFNITAVLEQNILDIISLPSNIPYFNLLILNTGQAVIAIFLASDFLKRDKKLDTSEIFYVRPLSNSEYMFGKIWGNIRTFIVLNIMSQVVVVLFTIASPDIPVDWSAHIVYLLVISLPTLIYIIGLSVVMMLILRNQAITFVLLLGYIGATIFYLNDKFYYLFDYMAYYLPLTKSTIVGFSNWTEIITHRLIYLFAGLTCILIAISLLGRLPNSSQSSYTWLILSLCTFLISVGSGYRHVDRILRQNENRRIYTQINNRYVHAPKMVIEQYDISVTQNPTASFTSETRMQGVALSSSQVFTFCLNPGLEIADVRSDDKPLRFTRERQILLIEFDAEIHAGDTVALSIVYGGMLDNSFCYLDITAEELNTINRKWMLSIDKQYSFQTDEYMLLTPETYWYPRPGTGYSDESPDWQQTYFSRFALDVTPLPGLIPVSQGDGLANDDGSYSFRPEYPVQAISLAVGKYCQKSLVRDSIRYSVWHIKGNDVFFATALDSIRDTIPGIINAEKENLEYWYKLDYPFRRFSIVEVPVQFQYYPHAWSQAQETVQPEIVFVVERGHSLYQLNAKKNVYNMRNSEYSPQEVQLWSLYDIISTFTHNRKYNASMNRGHYNVESEENPYLVFPQFYNFRYNIFSADWPVANRLIELYLQNNLEDVQWEREINGISKFEMANILLGQQPFKDLLANAEYRKLMNNIVGQKTFKLFAPAELKLGVGAFRDSLYAALSNYTFRNVRLENLLDTLGKVVSVNLLSSLETWNETIKLPVYSIGEPDVIIVNDRGKESFVVKVAVSNDSDYDGIIHMNLSVENEHNNPRTNRKITIPARRNLQLVYVFDNMPYNMKINTLISGNLPQVINMMPTQNIKHENRRLYEKNEDIILPDDYSDSISNEVTVDNEDSTLFTLSKKPVIGLLPKLLDKAGDSEFKYQGINPWKPNRMWTAITNEKLYGKYIRSAFVIRSTRNKSDIQTATWKIPIPSPGRYELYYHLCLFDVWHDKGEEYQFKIQYGKEVEDVYFELSNIDDGWILLGVYDFDSDTVCVTLSNESKATIIVADAVKIVKR